MKQLFSLSKKEFGGFFSSPTAYLFLGAFLATVLFTFFWVETFFARNIADLRPLFEWMPILLIFLVAALTMRSWSEERRMGTLELLNSYPLTPMQLVAGKFLACLALVLLALALTLPLPISVSMLGELDWGPVAGAYLAAIFLAAAYIGIGLTVSFISDNQIISLILTVLLGMLLYLPGSDLVTSLFNSETAELLKQFASGSRFASVARGVLDCADLYYYISLALVFLALNVYLLEARRWGKPGNRALHRHWRLLCGLLIANLLLGNVLLQGLNLPRIDLTQNQRYSISAATKSYLAQLQEPLLIRGYFSAKTHPFLAPLIPQLRDLISEYQVVGGDKVKIEFIDPTQSPELEQRAAHDYAIKPVPFQIADKYEASVVNAYFNVVLQYGDQIEVLGFRDLIESKSQTEGDINIALRNPEYDLTQAIKKVLYEYQSRDSLFSYMNTPVAFSGYFSADKQLPAPIAAYKQKILAVLKNTETQAAGKFSYQVIDPQANGGVVAADITRKFGFMPMRANPQDKRGFYFYMLLAGGKKAIQLPLPDTAEALERQDFQAILNSALKRYSPGFVKKIALSIPPAVEQNPLLSQYRMPSGRKFQNLRQRLSENYDIEVVDLKQGEVPASADLLMVIAPQQLKASEVFAIDQFLMKGGTVVLATGSAQASFNRNTLSAAPYPSGLEDWLKQQGVTVAKTLVLDPQNMRIPLPISRDAGGVPVQEIKMLQYPYVIDVNGAGLNAEHPIISGLQHVPIYWASPLSIELASDKLSLTPLLSSSEQSWTSSSMHVIPEFDKYPQSGFPIETTLQSNLLGAVLEGEFQSYFHDKPSPLTVANTQQTAEQSALLENPVIQQAVSSARLVIFSSNEFLTDQSMRLLASANGSLSMNAVNLIENTVDWAMQDAALLSIRHRGHFSTTLRAMPHQQELYWEYLNYVLAALGLFMVYLVNKLLRYARNKANAQLLAEVG